MMDDAEGVETEHLLFKIHLICDGHDGHPDESTI